MNGSYRNRPESLPGTMAHMTNLGLVLLLGDDSANRANVEIPRCLNPRFFSLDFRSRRIRHVIGSVNPFTLPPPETGSPLRTSLLHPPVRQTVHNVIGRSTRLNMRCAGFPAVIQFQS